MGLIYRIKRIAYNIRYYYIHLRRFNTIDLPKLTREEKRAIRDIWTNKEGDCLTIISLDYIGARVFKKINGFSPYYLTPCWYNELRYFMNPRPQLQALENKAMCDVYFPDLSFPEPYVRCLNGKFYDKSMNYITKEEAIHILEQKKSFIIKPSVESNQGQGVALVNCEKDDVKEAVKKVGRNFIAQEVLVQAPEIKRLNPSSLNCFRITSIYINGVYRYAAALKVGKKGAFRDNWNCSYWINVDDEGRLSKFGYDYYLNPVDRSDCGIVFENTIIPHYKEMIDYLEKMHKKLFANCGVVGWDVTIDENHKTRIIEANLCNTGTNIEQLVSGDFFRPFHDDLLALLKNKNEDH